VKFDCSITILNNPERFKSLMGKFEESVEKGEASKEILELLKRKPNSFTKNPSLLQKALIIGSNKRFIPFLFCHEERREFHAKYKVNISLHNKNVFQRSCLRKITRPTPPLGHPLTSSSAQDSQSNSLLLLAVAASTDKKFTSSSFTGLPSKGSSLQCSSAANHNDG
jgi:hypothetical protein